jgi:hypothetical protein
MSLHSGKYHDSVPTSGFDRAALGVVDQIKYLLDLAHRRAVAVGIPDSSREIAEKIIIQDSSLTVVGIDDPTVGHTRHRLHVPESTESLSRRSFCHSFTESVTFAVSGVPGILDGSYDCSIRWLTIPSSIKMSTKRRSKDIGFSLSTFL